MRIWQAAPPIPISPEQPHLRRKRAEQRRVGTCRGSEAMPCTHRPGRLDASKHQCPGSASGQNSTRTDASPHTGSCMDCFQRTTSLLRCTCPRGPMAEIPTHTHFLPTRTTTPSLQEQRPGRSQLHSQRLNSSEAPVRSGVRLCSQAQSQMTNTQTPGHHLLKLEPPNPCKSEWDVWPGWATWNTPKAGRGKGGDNPAWSAPPSTPGPTSARPRVRDGARRSAHPRTHSWGQGLEPQSAASSQSLSESSHPRRAPARTRPGTRNGRER